MSLRSDRKDEKKTKKTKKKKTKMRGRDDSFTLCFFDGFDPVAVSSDRKMAVDSLLVCSTRDGQARTSTRMSMKSRTRRQRQWSGQAEVIAVSQSAVIAGSQCEEKYSVERRSGDTCGSW